MRPETPKPSKVPSKDLSSTFNKDSSLIIIRKVINHLPYSCIVEIDFPDGYDSIYYAALDSRGEKLFYKSEYPTSTLPSFSSSDLQTNDSQFTLVCWPVKKGVIGKPSSIANIDLHPDLKLGTHDLQVDFDLEDKAFFTVVKPIIEQYYGKSALPGMVKVEEGNYDIYLPAYNKIKLSSDKRNLIHELVHASRKQFLFAMQDGRYSQKTEMIEEFFADGVANMVKDELNRTPNPYLTEGEVYGSTLGYNYDFRIADPSVITEDLQSTRGGILTLETSRYYLASEAYHKIALEYYIKTGRYFGKDFNEIYYRLLSAERRDPDHAMFIQICQKLISHVEGIETSIWLKNQKLFRCEYTKGEKIFMELQDYPMHDEWLGICKVYCYETFDNGSDWAMKEQRYNMNGSPLNIQVKEVATGNIIFSETCNISDYPNGFGFVKMYFYHREESPGLKHFTQQDQNQGTPFEVVFVAGGLYEINVRSKNTERTYYRFMGKTMYQHRDQLVFAYVGDSRAVNLHVEHQDQNRAVTKSKVQTIEENMCIIDLPIVKNKNCTPGILTIHLIEDGVHRSIQRNIGYGGSHGGHQFLIHAPTEIEQIV